MPVPEKRRVCLCQRASTATLVLERRRRGPCAASHGGKERCRGKAARQEEYTAGMERRRVKEREMRAVGKIRDRYCV